MKQADVVRLDKLAEEYSTHADYCRYMAENTRTPLLKQHWVRLAESWITLAAEAKARSRWTELASQ